jgi:hypothetical protein
MVLALGSHYIDNTCPNIPLQDTEGWKFFSAAHEKLPDLLQGSNLSALQALLLIVSLCRLHQSFGVAARMSHHWLLMTVILGSISSVYQPGIKVDTHGIMCADGPSTWLTS